jgi:hypothetical protein
MPVGIGCVQYGTAVRLPPRALRYRRAHRITASYMPARGPTAPSPIPEVDTRHTIYYLVGHTDTRSFNDTFSILSDDEECRLLA